MGAGGARKGHSDPCARWGRERPSARALLRSRGRDGLARAGARSTGLRSDPACAGLPWRLWRVAGGGGAGKSSANALVGEQLAGAHTLLDGTLSSPDKAARLVNLAMQNGQEVVVTYIYRDPIEAFENRQGGVLMRAMENGRTVPIDSLVKTHSGASETVRMLQDAYGADPRFALLVVDNSRGAGNAALSDLQSITPVIKSGLKEKLNEAADQALAEGFISRVVYDETTAGLADTRAEAQGQARDGRDRTPDAEGVQGRGGLEGAQDALSLSAK